MYKWKQSKGIGWEVGKDGEIAVVIDNPESLFDMVRKLTDQETAIEVDGWAELATVGEVYEIKDIVIEVIDLLMGGCKC